VRLEEIVKKDRLHSPIVGRGKSLLYNMKKNMMNRYSLSILIIAQVVVV
jgi:hypothetical protein